MIPADLAAARPPATETIDPAFSRGFITPDGRLTYVGVWSQAFAKGVHRFDQEAILADITQQITPHLESLRIITSSRGEGSGVLQNASQMSLDPILLRGIGVDIPEEDLPIYRESLRVIDAASDMMANNPNFYQYFKSHPGLENQQNEFALKCTAAYILVRKNQPSVVTTGTSPSGPDVAHNLPGFLYGHGFQVREGDEYIFTPVMLGEKDIEELSQHARSEAIALGVDLYLRTEMFDLIGQQFNNQSVEQEAMLQVMDQYLGQAGLHVRRHSFRQTHQQEDFRRKVVQSGLLEMMSPDALARIASSANSLEAQVAEALSNVSTRRGQIDAEIRGLQQRLESATEEIHKLLALEQQLTSDKQRVGEAAGQQRLRRDFEQQSGRPVDEIIPVATLSSDLARTLVREQPESAMVGLIADADTFTRILVAAYAIQDPADQQALREAVATVARYTRATMVFDPGFRHPEAIESEIAKVRAVIGKDRLEQGRDRLDRLGQQTGLSEDEQNRISANLAKAQSLTASQAAEA